MQGRSAQIGYGTPGTRDPIGAVPDGVEQRPPTRLYRHGLALVAESSLPSGMRALNPQPGHIRVAGAAVEGFADGRLFAVTFRVTDPRALASMELTLDEMSGTDFGNRLPANPLHRSVRLGSTRE